MASAGSLLIHPVRDATVVTFQETSILDTAQVEAIGRQLLELVADKNRRKLILDFSQVQFMSSSALGILIQLNKQAAAIKGQVIICSLKKELKRVFEITSLHKLFTFCDDEKQALERFGITTA
mgnify:CR=1 FL=1